ncbi:MAG TPA: hypothetical protein VFE39_07570 [Pseudonocardia sp.]|nr:hypothetical protein [Pseudonocardia sp.]
MTQSTDVPPEIVAQPRSVCLGLPEAYEEPAWVVRSGDGRSA